MTPDDVDSAFYDIANCSQDDEKAHGMEDKLHVAVLKAIADGTAENPQECARRALKTCDLDFARWCA